MKAIFVFLALSLAIGGCAPRAEHIQSRDTISLASPTATWSLIPEARAQDSVPVIVAPPVPESNFDAIKLLPSIWKALKDKNWAIAVSLLIMLLVWAGRKFVVPGLNPSAVPLVVAGMGLLVGLAGSIGAGAPIIPSLLSGLFVGAAASGFWEQIFKHFLSPKAPDVPKA